MYRNPILDEIKARRSIRKFKPDMPEQGNLEKIMEAGIYAANGYGQQSSMVVAVTNRELRDRLSDLNRRLRDRPDGYDPFYGAPVVLLVLSDSSSRFKVEDGSLTAGNMMLAAHSLGLGSCWIHRADEVFASEDGKAILREIGIDGEWEGIAQCLIGYVDGSEPEAAPRKPGRMRWSD